MSIIQSLYDSNKYFRSIAQKLGFGRPINVDLLSSRLVEYPWVLNNLSFKTTNTVLDIGSCGSQLPLMMAGMGLDVWTLDIRKYEYSGIVENLHSICGDVTKTNFPDGNFDAVTAVSTIEHIGLGRYGDFVDNEGDLKTMDEIYRITSSKANILVTIPFGKKCITHSYRVYDRNSLDLLFKDFVIQDASFFMNKGKLWAKSNEQEVGDLDSSVKELGTGCFKLIKK